MAERLTRTKKYADLRNQIANDREESLETIELNSYQEKLNNVKSQFGRDTEPVFNSTPVNKPVEEKSAVTEEVRKVEKESMKSLDDILNAMMNESYNVATPIEEKVEEPAPQVEETIQSAPSVEEKVEAAVVPTLETVKPQINEEPTNEFVQKALDGANDYNRKAGNITLDELPNTLVDKIRHGENVVNDKANDVDDDFSNTVSLEIEKVLAEIKNQKVEEEKKPISIVEAELVDDIETPAKEENVQPEPVQETIVAAFVQPEPVQEVKVEAPIQPEPTQQEPKQETFEHPVLTKTLEQPVVEIKNISETLNMQRTNEDIVDDTIPFNANKVQEEFDDDEYEEEEGPSKVLNVILGILIFVLVAVLGIIVYYILVAKGIIG